MALSSMSALRPGVWVPLPSLLRATEPDLILWGQEKVSPAVNYFHTIFQRAKRAQAQSFPAQGLGYQGGQSF